MNIHVTRLHKHKDVFCDAEKEMYFLAVIKAGSNVNSVVLNAKMISRVIQFYTSGDNDNSILRSSYSYKNSISEQVMSLFISYVVLVRISL